MAIFRNDQHLAQLMNSQMNSLHHYGWETDQALTMGALQSACDPSAYSNKPPASKSKDSTKPQSQPLTHDEEILLLLEE